jgi:hypothetical protein
LVHQGAQQAVLAATGGVDGGGRDPGAGGDVLDWAGRAVRDGAQVIDLRGMREVKVDSDVATVGGGATANDLIAAAAVSGMSAALAPWGWRG